MQGRGSRVSSDVFAKPPKSEGAFSEFLASLPDILEAASFKAVAQGIAGAAKAGKGALWMLGGHTVKTGLAPLLIRMMERGAATLMAGNGSVAIHDYEVARWGATSEDVEAGLGDGTFGMAEETGREMNEALAAGADLGMGFGEAIGHALSRRGDLVAPDRSLLLQEGAAIGECSMRDFRRLAEALPSLDEGGVVLNLGSAVIMPEVFLKALALARNVHGGRPRRFLAADFDMIRHYRPGLNVVQRPTRSGGGTGYRITGHHEIMIPLLAWAVEEYLAG
jgi:hypothetical protein